MVDGIGLQELGCIGQRGCRLGRRCKLVDGLRIQKLELHPNLRRGSHRLRCTHLYLEHPESELGIERSCSERTVEVLGCSVALERYIGLVVGIVVGTGIGLGTAVGIGLELDTVVGIGPGLGTVEVGIAGRSWWILVLG